MRQKGQALRLRRAPVVLVLAIALPAACSSGSEHGTGTRAPTAAPATAGARPLRILVTNDDGVAAAGIDAVVQALRTLPNTTVTVVAPATNQSGTGGRTTPGPLTATAARTAGSYPATAVHGTPADTIIYALDRGGLAARPDLVVAGINEGQNLGPLVDVSGTVGAARAAAQRGIPALAVSQGFGKPPAYPDGVRAALEWVAAHRAELLARAPSSAATVTNLNVPTCPAGKPHPVVLVPVDPSATGIGPPVNCVAAYPSPKTDVDAFLHGYVSETDNLPAPSTR